ALVSRSCRQSSPPLGMCTNCPVLSHKHPYRAIPATILRSTQRCPNRTWQPWKLTLARLIPALNLLHTPGATSGTAEQIRTPAGHPGPCRRQPPRAVRASPPDSLAQPPHYPATTRSVGITCLI